MSTRVSPTSDNTDEETPIQRAARILQESIQFRTTIFSEVHKEIHAATWEGWGIYHPHINMSRSRTTPLCLNFVNSFYADLGGGRRHYTGVIRR